MRSRVPENDGKADSNPEKGIAEGGILYAGAGEGISY